MITARNVGCWFLYDVVECESVLSPLMFVVATTARTYEWEDQRFTHNKNGRRKERRSAFMHYIPPRVTSTAQQQSSAILSICTAHPHTFTKLEEVWVWGEGRVDSALLQGIECWGMRVIGKHKKKKRKIEELARIHQRDDGWRSVHRTTGVLPDLACPPCGESHRRRRGPWWWTSSFIIIQCTSTLLFRQRRV